MRSRAVVLEEEDRGARFRPPREEGRRTFLAECAACAAIMELGGSGQIYTMVVDRIGWIEDSLG